MATRKDTIQPLIDELPLDNRREILLMRSQGKSYSIIARYVTERIGRNVEWQIVKRWIAKRKDAIKLYVYGSSQFADKVADEFASVITELSELSDIVMDRIKKISQGEGPSGELYEGAKTQMEVIKLARDLLDGTEDGTARYTSNISETVKSLKGAVPKNRLIVIKKKLEEEDGDK